MCRVMSAVDCCSVLTARNSTPSTSASTMRLTAFTPAPPTPSTLIRGWETGPSGNVGCSYSPITGRAAPARAAEPSMAPSRSIRLAGISAENACLRRSFGLGTLVPVGPSSACWVPALSAGWGAPRSSSVAGIFDCGALTSAASPAPAPAPVASSSSVLRNRAASGPSRMDARLGFAMCEDLLGELPVGLRGHAGGLVLEHRHALHGRLREAHRLADARREHAVAEVLLEDLDRLLGVDRAHVDQGRRAEERRVGREGGSTCR